MSRLAAPLFALALLASCESVTGPEKDLASAQEKWRRDKPANYDMTLQRVCECLPATLGPVEIVVRGGVVRSRRYAINGADVSAVFADVFPDVDDLFYKIRSALWAHVNKIEVEYDETLGYPTSIYVDPDKVTADDEVVYTVTRLELR